MYVTQPYIDVKRGTQGLILLVQIQAAATVRTAAKSALNMLNPMSYRSGPQSSRVLLSNFYGTVGAGEMLLVIGRPGSGCTTFLKTLANMRGEYKETSGKVTYGGRSAKEMAQNDAAEIAFCGMFDPKLAFPSTAHQMPSS